ncbi:MAG TPA: hypothetical protein VMI94_01820 [Bryobacteraceae bacterium]|nr:hypothetical protein [Bryobacteraceae bacterium]
MRVTAIIVAAGTAAAVGIGWGQSSAAQPASACTTDALPLLKTVWAEMRNLRQELLEQRRAIEQAKIADLERQLKGIQEQRRVFDEDRSSRDQQLAAIETALLQSNPDKQERDELESQRAQLLSAPSGPPPTVENAISQREARVRDQLAETEQRARALDQLVQQLAADASR